MTKKAKPKMRQARAGSRLKLGYNLNALSLILVCLSVVPYAFDLDGRSFWVAGFLASLLAAVPAATGSVLAVIGSVKAKKAERPILPAVAVLAMGLASLLLAFGCAYVMAFALADWGAGAPDPEFIWLSAG